MRSEDNGKNEEALGGMSNEIEETRGESVSRVGASSWCEKIFEYVKNRNRIGPGKLELANCDFFNVGPRRTLRVLVPVPRGNIHYETRPNERPETMDENFVSCWTSRPHPSANCRCGSLDRRGKDASVRSERRAPRSKTRASSRENVAEKSGEPVNDRTVKELEDYIEELLRRVLADTIKFLDDAGDTLKTSREMLNAVEGTCNVTEPPSDSSDIGFAFHGNESTTRQPGAICYVNRGFAGSVNDPDSLDFHLDRYPALDKDNHHSDCTDSGINSVETMEFQISQRVSLEESLMEIIEAKFGPRPRPSSSSSSSSVASTKELPCDDITEEDSTLGIPENETIISSLDRSIQRQSGGSDGSIVEALGSSGIGAAEILTEKINVTEVSREKLMEKSRSAREEDRETKKCVAGTSRRPVSEIREKMMEPTTENSVEDSVELRKIEKPVVVFLHGFGSSAEIFENQLEYFSKLGYPCVAPELLGHGMSSAPDRPGDYRFDELLKNLETVLRHYVFRDGKKCVLVAHNYGCSFATALACKYESNVRQLVLISGGGPTPLVPPRSEAPGNCCLRGLLRPFLMCGLGRDALYSPTGRQHPYCGAEPIEQRPSHMKYVLDGMIWPEGDYVFHRRINAPTLLVHGLRDDTVSLVQECQMERTIIKAFLDAIPTAGHTPMIDCPEQINHTIHCFIDLWKRKKR